MGKAAYFWRSLIAQFDWARLSCPNCGSSHSTLVDQKYVITKLRRCQACELLFRTPTDKPEDNEKFYDEQYSQGFTTDLPSDDVLDQLKRSNFAGTEKDYSYYIDVLHQIGLKRGDKIFDFGCSWGYGSFQLAVAGFDVVAYEVAPKRRQYAETKLGVKSVTDLERAVTDPSHRGSYNCFFSSHVMEHVPSPSMVFQYAFELLRDGGLFVSFTPNGSPGFREANINWHKLWGEVHPQFIDDGFLNRSFSNSPRALGSSPVRDAHLPEGVCSRVINGLSEYELFFAARKFSKCW